MARIRILFFGLVCFTFISKVLPAQNITEFQKSYQYSIKPTSQKIKVDGILDENVWVNAEVANHFSKRYPNDIGEVKYRQK
jgi:hypothetical protein